MSSVSTFINHRGMTLVELMVSIGITLMVMTLTVSIFMGQYKSYVKRKDANEITESTPPVAELLKRDLMLAGWSVRPDMAFFFEDGGANGSDRIYVNDSTIIDEEHSAEITKFMKEDCSGCLQTQAINQLPRLDIDDEEGDQDDATGKDFVKGVHQFIMTSSSNLRAVRLGGTDPEDTSLSVELFSTADSSVSLPTDTWAAPAIYYCMDDGNSAQCHPDGSPSQWVLRRSDRKSRGLQTMAENVVDLQVAYRSIAGTWYGAAGCEDRGDCAPASFSSAEIDLVRFTLVTRSTHRDKVLINNSNYCRPAVENRAGASAGSDECGYTYRIYRVQVRPRNT